MLSRHSVAYPPPLEQACWRDLKFHTKIKILVVLCITDYTTTTTKSSLDILI